MSATPWGGADRIALLGVAALHCRKGVDVSQWEIELESDQCHGFIIHHGRTIGTIEIERP